MFDLQTTIDRHTRPESDPPHTPAPIGAASARDIVTYAHKLSYTTFAPFGFVPGVTPLRNFRPPAPQEQQLRASALHGFARKSRCSVFDLWKPWRV